MSKVVFHVSISVDGFFVGPEATADEPLGKGGQRLHQWAFEDDRGQAIGTALLEESGAFIAGRRTYDDSIRWWGPNGPAGAKRIPVFVPTHEPPANSADGSVYTFVTGGIEATLEQAKAAAGGKTVAISGGETADQLIRAGLLDEIALHIAPFLFGGGKPLFGTLGEHVELEQISAEATPHATHLTYRVAR